MHEMPTAENEWESKEKLTRWESTPKKFGEMSGEELGAWAVEHRLPQNFSSAIAYMAEYTFAKKTRKL